MSYYLCIKKNCVIGYFSFLYAWVWIGFKICLPYFSGHQLSISCLKCMNVVNINIFCYLVAIFLTRFSFDFVSVQFVASDKVRLLVLKAKILMIFCFIHDEISLLQFYIDQLELISLLFKVSKLSAFSFCKLQFATVFINTFKAVFLLFRLFSQPVWPWTM